MVPNGAWGFYLQPPSIPPKSQHLRGADRSHDGFLERLAQYAGNEPELEGNLNNAAEVWETRKTNSNGSPSRSVPGTGSVCIGTRHDRKRVLGWGPGSNATA